MSKEDRALCRRCDVYVGYGAIGVARVPPEYADDPEWLGIHCWICRRHVSEILAKPFGRRKVKEN